ncbi:MAG: dTDP-4-dehydrorhamnose 3,5-epimerase, partial [Hafnia sp.]
WNDTDLNISWPITTPPLLSGKDTNGATLKAAEVFA